MSLFRRWRSNSVMRRKLTLRHSNFNECFADKVSFRCGCANDCSWKLVKKLVLGVVKIVRLLTNPPAVTTVRGHRIHGGYHGCA